MNTEDPIYTLSPGDKTIGVGEFYGHSITSRLCSCFRYNGIDHSKKSHRNAGTSLQICEGESVTISSATAQFSNSTNWTQSGGLGTFTNTSYLAPTYNSV